MSRAAPRPGGFTMIEMLAVLAILSVLAMAVWPLAQMNLQRDRERELKRALWEIRDAIDAYKRMADAGALAVSGGSGYPPDLPSLAAGVVDRRSGQLVYFLRRVPRDPFADPALADEQTWGVRSYQSSAQNPQPGSDVFDVYSRSDTVALDGTPVRRW
jgi:general secretion pathway protein G